ncbi:MAG: MotA/TolQ/ExbB proton channel family protein [bacterium]
MIIEFIQKGGPVMWPLLIVALAATYLIIYKSWEVYRLLRRYTSSKLNDKVRNLVKEKNFKAAHALLRDDGPNEKILGKALSYLEQGYSEEAMKDRLEMIYEDEVQKLDKGLPVLLILGEIMPMLGLLGTVSGMIQVFKAISSHGTGDAQALASGISEALLTTEVGLVLAIPTMFCYTLLNGKVEALSKLMRQAAASVITISRVLKKNDHR